MNCLGCGCSKEFEKDRFCQACEGKHDAEIVSETVRHEVLFVAQKLRLNVESLRMVNYKHDSLDRWKNQALAGIDTETFKVYYQNFMRVLNRLTDRITPSLKEKEVAPAQYEE